MILSVCSNSSVLQILYIIKIIIRAICIIVPIILIVSLSISFAQGVMSAEINEILKKSIPKIVAAILVFLIPTFVNIITSITGSKGYIGCLNNATIEGIKQAKYDEVNVYIEKANSSLNRGDLSIAKSKINKLSDESQKEELLNKIKETESKISKIEEIMNYSENTITQEKYDEALAFANKLPDGNSKSSLLEKLENLKEALTPPTPSLGSGSVENNVSGNNIADYLKLNHL